MPSLCQKDGRYMKDPRVFNKSLPPKINLLGQKFGKLTVIEWAGNWNHKNFWVCECECGDLNYNPVITETRCLRSGNTGSCGCNNRKHNMTNSAIYNIWVQMIKRCTNPNCPKYPYYGGRGITVCDRWLESFKNFYEDMGEPPGLGYTLDRINNNAGYSPDNCRYRNQ